MKRKKQLIKLIRLSEQRSQISLNFTNNKIAVNFSVQEDKNEYYSLKLSVFFVCYFLFFRCFHVDVFTDANRAYHSNICANCKYPNFFRFPFSLSLILFFHFLYFHFSKYAKYNCLFDWLFSFISSNFRFILFIL